MKSLPKLTCFLAVFLFATALQVHAAGYKNTIGGVTIKYSLPDALATLDPSGFLLISIGASGGSLKITADATARANWGDFCPLFLSASGRFLKSISIKGRARDAFSFSIVGECFHANKVSLKDADVGGITLIGGDPFDPELGLYFDLSSPNPISLTIKNGVAWGPLGGALVSGAIESPDNAGSPDNAKLESNLLQEPRVADRRLRDLLTRARATGGVVLAHQRRF